MSPVSIYKHFLFLTIYRYVLRETFIKKGTIHAELIKFLTSIHMRSRLKEKEEPVQMNRLFFYVGVTYFPGQSPAKYRRRK